MRYSLAFFLVLITTIGMAQTLDLFFLRKVDGTNRFILKDPGSFDAWTGSSYSFGTSDVANFDFVLSSDFNGDCLTDLYFLKKSDGTNKFILKDAEDIDAWATASYSFDGSDVSNYDIVIPGDFNNDGLTDLSFLRISDGTNRFILKDPGNFNAWTGASYSFGTSDVSNYDIVVPGDFNNDGLTDLYFLRKSDGTNRFILKDPGNFNAWTGASYSFDASDVSNYDFVIPGDYNDDDLTDLFFLRQSDGTNRFILKDAGNFNAWSGTSYSFGTSDVSNYDILAPGDYNGDCRIDFFFLRQSDGTNKFILKDPGNVDLWTTASYSFGTSDVVNYDFVVPGYYTERDPTFNIKDGGTIGTDQIICFNTTPATLNNITLPTGGKASSAIEYLWKQAAPGSMFPGPDWQDIPNSNTPTLSPGNLSESTAFIRCARRAGFNEYPGISNMVEITVLPDLSVTSMIPTSTFVESNVQIETTLIPNANYTWDFGADATPASAMGHTVNDVSWSTPGIKTIKLSVEDQSSCLFEFTYSIEVFMVPTLSITDMDGDGNPDITDPCSCQDPLNQYDATGMITFFHDFIQISSTTGEIWRLSDLNAGGLFDVNGNPLVDDPSSGTIIPETSTPGIYFLDVYHQPNIGFDAEFNRAPNPLPVPLAVSNTCTEACMITVIPTMGEWALIFMGLVLMTLFTVVATTPKVVLSGAGSLNWQLVPFEINAYSRFFGLVIFIVISGFTIAIQFFGYELTNADPFGAVTCSYVLAYWLFLVSQAKGQMSKI